MAAKTNHWRVSCVVNRSEEFNKLSGISHLTVTHLIFTPDGSF